MKKFILLVVMPFVFLSASFGQITRDASDSIVLERMSLETRPHTVYLKTDTTAIATKAGELLELDYSCWIYYIHYEDQSDTIPATRRYLVVKESSGNVLEVRTKDDVSPPNLAAWIKITDFIDIEDLYAQPLPIIKQYLHGKWQGVKGSRNGTFGLFGLTNIIVNIDTINNNISTTGEEDFGETTMLHAINRPASYTWEEKEVYSPTVGQRPPCCTTYVMRFDELNTENPKILNAFTLLGVEDMGWYFWNIRNDVLQVIVDFSPATVNFNTYERYEFKRIRE